MTKNKTYFYQRKHSSFQPKFVINSIKIFLCPLFAVYVHNSRFKRRYILDKEIHSGHMTIYKFNSLLQTDLNLESQSSRIAPKSSCMHVLDLQFYTCFFKMVEIMRLLSASRLLTHVVKGPSSSNGK